MTAFIAFAVVLILAGIVWTFLPNLASQARNDGPQTRAKATRVTRTIVWGIILAAIVVFALFAFV